MIVKLKDWITLEAQHRIDIGGEIGIIQKSTWEDGKGV